MHYVTRGGNEAILQTIVDHIGPGAVQIALNKQSKVMFVVRRKTVFLYRPVGRHCWRHAIEAISSLLKFSSSNMLALMYSMSRAKQVHHSFFTEAYITCTGLHLAASNGHIQVCDILLKHKAFVNSKNKNGETPLHLAAQNGYSRVCVLLIQVRAIIACVLSSALTLLQDHNASLETCTMENQTPLHYAAKNGKHCTCNAMIVIHFQVNYPCRTLSSQWAPMQMRETRRDKLHCILLRRQMKDCELCERLHSSE